MLLRDKAGVHAAFQAAAAMPGHDGEPWDYFGVPEWPKDMQRLARDAAPEARSR